MDTLTLAAPSHHALPNLSRLRVRNPGSEEEDGQEEPSDVEEGGEDLLEQLDRPLVGVTTARAPPSARWHWPVHTVLVAVAQVVLYYATDTHAHFAMPLPLAEGDSWRLLTLILAHGDATHLWSNVVGLLVLGTAFEIYDGFVATAVVYWGSGVFGSALTVALWSDRCSLALGASGAVYGLVGALLAGLLVNWQELAVDAEALGLRRCRRGLACVLALAQLAAAALLAAVIGVEGFLAATRPDTGVAYAAHFFGALYGLVLGLVAAHNLVPHRWERWLAFLALLVATASLAVAAVVVSARVADWRDGPRCE